MRACVAAGVVAALVLSGPVRADAPGRASSPAVLRVMPLGDSITRGVGDPGLNGYRAVLRARLDAAGVAVDFVGSQTAGTGDSQHEGHGGWRIDQLTGAAPGLVRAYRPDVVLLMAGTNGLLQGRYAGMAGRLEVLVRAVQAARPGVVVLLSTPPQLGLREPARIAGWNTLRAAVPVVAARTGARWVAGNRVYYTTDLSADRVHPSLCGYTKLAFLWWVGWSQQFRAPNGAGWDPGTLPPTCRP